MKIQIKYLIAYREQYYWPVEVMEKSQLTYSIEVSIYCQKMDFTFLTY